MSMIFVPQLVKSEINFNFQAERVQFIDKHNSYNLLGYGLQNKNSSLYGISVISKILNQNQHEEYTNALICARGVECSNMIFWPNRLGNLSKTIAHNSKINNK